METVSCSQSDPFDHKPVYRDFATIVEQDWNKTSTMKSANFPAKLHYVLSDMEQEGLTHIASWQTHGRSFSVHDKKLFTEKILPFWFRQSKFDSFQRQLNSYGFIRIKSGPDKGGYYHELFLRGKIFLTTGIDRNKKTRRRTARKQANRPNFALHQFPSLPDMNSKQAAKNINSHSIAISKQRDDPPVVLQRANNFKPSFSIKGHDITRDKSVLETSQLDVSSTSPLLDSRTTHISPSVMSTSNFSLVDMLLFHELQRRQGNSWPGAANI